MSADGGERSERWVSFELAGQLYALPILGVQEVLTGAQIEPVPGAPTTVLGVLNLRGSIVTVIDLRRRLGLPPQPGSDGILVALCGTDVVGLAIDRVADVVAILPSTIQPPPPSPEVQAPPMSCGLVQWKERVLTLLEATRLLPAAG